MKSSLRFSLFLSVTSVTSGTTEKNHEVAVSRLCPNSGKRDNLGGEVNA
jgi:hypothetical protein